MRACSTSTSRDVAAASGTTDNIYSIDSEYYDVVGGMKTYITLQDHRRDARYSTPTPSRPTAASRRPASLRASPTPSCATN